MVTNHRSIHCTLSFGRLINRFFSLCKLCSGIMCGRVLNRDIILLIYLASDMQDIRVLPQV